MLILQDIQGSMFQTASGFPTSSNAFLEIINQVIPRLLNRGDWPGTLLPIITCVRSGCLTFPRYVGTVRAMRSCRRGDIPIQNPWGDFLSYGGRNRHHWEDWQGEERRMVTQYHAPTYQDVCGTTSQLRMYVDVPQDVGATMTIFGADGSGQPLQTQNGDGTWSLGLTLTAQMPFAQSTTVVTRIDRVVCTKTNSQKRLFAFDTSTGNLYDLAVYSASETVPSYIRYRLYEGHRYCCSNTCQEKVIALVKLKYVPAKDPTDGLILLEGAQGAILHGIRAFKCEGASDAAGAKGFWTLAIEEMNRCLDDFSPPEQFVASDNTWGDERCFQNQMF